MVLEGHIIRQYFDKVEVSNFEVASDAFSTFKDLLSRHKPLVVSYLQTHYDEVGSCSSEIRKASSLQQGLIPVGSAVLCGIHQAPEVGQLCYSSPVPEGAAPIH